MLKYIYLGDKMSEFSSSNDLSFYLIKKWLRYVDSGSEGKFYISDIDGMGYKIFSKEEFLRPLYKPSNIIMDEEVNIESFMFPESLLIVDGELHGYVTRVVEKNLFSNWMKEFFTSDGVNFHKFKLAYQNFKLDVALLTSKKIKICDLANNLLFDGEKFYAVDTCSYSYSDEEDLLAVNFKSLEDAMDVIFTILSISSDRKVLTREKTGLSIVDHIDYISITLSQYNFLKNKQKILGKLNQIKK